MATINMTLEQMASRAGKIDNLFRTRAIEAGGPYATRSLISGIASRRQPFPATLLRNAAGRAAAYLSTEEVREWTNLIASVNAALPNRSLGLAYDLSATF